MNGPEYKLEHFGVYQAKTEGNSMLPLMKKGTVVIIKKPTGALRKYDVVLYRRGDHYTLHRIICKKRNSLVICGDNRLFVEKDIREKDILGVLVGFYDGTAFVDCNDMDYRKRVKKICRTNRIRRIKYRLKRFITVR